MSRKNDKMLINPEPICKPLDTYDDIISFLENPPSWRSLCKEITPHSKDKIRNMSLNSMVGAMGPDRPPTFCHFSPDSEDVERQSADALPKTLVCHDMANGYHDDSMIDGTPNHSAYTFYHWAGIDIFCYFSHHLITIPPLGWINVGHAHGVKVIGTLITEWSEGYDFWEFMLSSESQYQELASALVSIAKLLRFDGWLLNVENKISQPQVLVEFVKCLHGKLHAELEEPVLLWYDSVTVKGNLNWQNGLNEHNKEFFDACDGIFTNYSWKEADLESSAAAAGGRLRDLFVGIDVWGRNFYGGGQFNTAEAIELASGYGCSLAIFAPGWTYETAERRDADIALADHLDAIQHVRLRERALWGSLWPYLATSLPCRLPFHTSFCQGHGVKRRLYGEVLSPGPWYNLRHMQYQPNSAYGPHGYLLSTPDRIHAMSRHAIVRDKKGIIKFHAAFEHSRHELHTVRSTRELEELQREHHDSLIVVTVEEEERKAREDEKKHSMKNVFKHMFRIKSRRRTEDSEEEAANHSQNHYDKTHDQTPDPALDKHDKPDQHVQIHDTAHEQAHVQINDESPDKSRDESPDKSHDESDKHHHELHDRTHEAGHSAHSWHDVKSGWSMRQMSVNIKLGPQPNKTRLALACVPGELPCLEPYYEDSYIGGSCLCVNPSDQVSPEHRWTRLFHCEFPCPADLVVCVVTKSLPEQEQYLNVKVSPEHRWTRLFPCEFPRPADLVVCVVIKSLPEQEQYLNVKLFARDSSDQEVRVTCVGRSLPGGGGNPESAGGALLASRSVSLYPLAEGAELKALQKYLLLNEPGFYMSVENSYGWKVRYYIAPLASTVVTSVNLHCGLASGPVLLGHIGLCLRTREEAEDSSDDWTDESPRSPRQAPRQNYTSPGAGAAGARAALGRASQQTIKTLESESPYFISPIDSKAIQTVTSSVLQNLDRKWKSEDYGTVDYVAPRSFKKFRDSDGDENDPRRSSKDSENESRTSYKDSETSDHPKSSQDLKTENVSSRDSKLKLGRANSKETSKESQKSSPKPSFQSKPERSKDPRT